MQMGVDPLGRIRSVDTIGMSKGYVRVQCWEGISNLASRCLPCATAHALKTLHVSPFFQARSSQHSAAKVSANSVRRGRDAPAEEKAPPQSCRKAPLPGGADGGTPVSGKPHMRRHSSFAVLHLGAASALMYYALHPGTSRGSHAPRIQHQPPATRAPPRHDTHTCAMVVPGPARRLSCLQQNTCGFSSCINRAHRYVTRGKCEWPPRVIGQWSHIKNCPHRFWTRHHGATRDNRTNQHAVCQ